MHEPPYLLYALIVACELAFWLVLASSLIVRYLLRREALSRWLLWSLPLIDLLLLIFTALDLRAGAPASTAHGLSAAYVGFTLAFGALVVGWADARFAHRFASGAAPPSAPAAGWSLVWYDLTLWLRCIGAWIIALALIEALGIVAGADAATSLRDWYRYALGSVFFWFVFGPLWSLTLVRRG